MSLDTTEGAELPLTLLGILVRLDGFGQGLIRSRIYMQLSYFQQWHAYNSCVATKKDMGDSLMTCDSEMAFLFKYLT